MIKADNPHTGQWTVVAKRLIIALRAIPILRYVDVPSYISPIAE
jgi:hypothetical protein